MRWQSHSSGRGAEGSTSFDFSYRAADGVLSYFAPMVAEKLKSHT
jgi:hypothetical protein